MNDGIPTPDELEALFRAPSATTGPEALVVTAPRPKKKRRKKRWERDLDAAQERQRAEDAIWARDARDRQIERDREMALLKRNGELSHARHLQAMAQLSGPPPSSPVPLNFDFFTKRHGFMIGFVVGAVAATVVSALFWNHE